MYFKGDIIITDPGNFVRDDRIDIPDDIMRLEPQPQNFMRYPSRTQYPDFKRKTESELSDAEREEFNQFKKQLLDMKLGIDITDTFASLLPTTSKMYDEDFNKYIEAKKKWEEPYMSDWEKSNCGENLSILGFSNYMSSLTHPGSYTCGAFSNGKCIGKFFSVSGIIVVTTLEEMLKYDPDFNIHETHPQACAIIKNFDGDITFKIKETSFDTVLQIIGKGNINFKTAQIR